MNLPTMSSMEQERSIAETLASLGQPASADRTPPKEGKFPFNQGQQQQQQQPPPKSNDSSTGVDPKKQSSTNNTVWRENDILAGRSREVRCHIGNVKFRELIDEYQPAYKKAGRKLEKSRIAVQVYKIIESRGGRFLDCRPEDPDSWFEISYDKAVAKVSQTLRKGAKHMKPLSSTTSSATAIQASKKTKGTSKNKGKDAELSRKKTSSSDKKKSSALDGSSFSDSDTADEEMSTGDHSASMDTPKQATKVKKDQTPKGTSLQLHRQEQDTLLAGAGAGTSGNSTGVLPPHESTRQAPFAVDEAMSHTREFDAGPALAAAAASSSFQHLLSPGWSNGGSMIGNGIPSKQQSSTVTPNFLQSLLLAERNSSFIPAAAHHTPLAGGSSDLQALLSTLQQRQQTAATTTTAIPASLGNNSALQSLLNPSSSSVQEIQNLLQIQQALDLERLSAQEQHLSGRSTTQGSVFDGNNRFAMHQGLLQHQQQPHQPVLLAVPPSQIPGSTHSESQPLALVVGTLGTCCHCGAHAVPQLLPQKSEEPSHDQKEQKAQNNSIAASRNAETPSSVPSNRSQEVHPET